jgi:hypothetical protein
LLLSNFTFISHSYNPIKMEIREIYTISFNERKKVWQEKARGVGRQRDVIINISLIYYLYFIVTNGKFSPSFLMISFITLNLTLNMKKTCGTLFYYSLSRSLWMINLFEAFTFLQLIFFVFEFLTQFFCAVYCPLSFLFFLFFLIFFFIVFEASK